MENNLVEPTIEDMKAELARYQGEVAKWTDLYVQYSSAGNKSAAYAKHEADNANRNVEFIKRQLKKIMENNRAQQLVQKVLKEVEIQPMAEAGVKSYQLTQLGLENLKEFLATDIKSNKFYNLEMVEEEPYTQLGHFMSLLDDFGGVKIDAEGFQFLAEDDPIALKMMIKLKLVEPIKNTMREAEGDTSAKADETFKTLEAILLDLRNAESKLVMGISYDMQNLFGDDLNAIKGVIENASTSVENLAKKMHQQLLQEGKSNQSAADKFGDWFTENKY